MEKLVFIYISSLLLISIMVLAKSEPDTEPIDVNQVHSPKAQCKFTVHEKNANGAEIEGTNLNQELYYKISCQKDEGYCLFVSNCTASTSSEKSDSYTIIDEKGCTNEPSLFEHVEYLDDFTAGIYNPYPIRFRNPGTGVHFQCSTTLKPQDLGGHCERPACTKNLYSKEGNFNSH